MKSTPETRWIESGRITLGGCKGFCVNGFQVSEVRLLFLLQRTGDLADFSPDPTAWKLIFVKITSSGL
jgi:hypothetical protein